MRKGYLYLGGDETDFNRDGGARAREGESGGRPTKRRKRSTLHLRASSSSWGCVGCVSVSCFLKSLTCCCSWVTSNLLLSRAVTVDFISLVRRFGFSCDAPVPSSLFRRTLSPPHSLSRSAFLFFSLESQAQDDFPDFLSLRDSSFAQAREHQLP